MIGPPVGLFGMVLGLGGLGLLWGQFAWLAVPARAMLAIAAIAFVVLAAFYAAKAVRAPQAVAAEWRHPAAHCFFPAITMSILVLAQGALPHAWSIATALFWIGCVGQGALAVVIVARWLGGAFARDEMTPGWFLPTFGGMVASVAGVPLGEYEAAWAFFLFGAVTGIPLMGLVLRRLWLGPLPLPAAPQLAILTAPIALSFIAWLALNGGVLDPIGYGLFVAEWALIGFALARARPLVGIPFGLGWWALSFPLDLTASATLMFARLEPLGLALAALASAVILYLFVRTLIAAALAA